MSNDISLPNYPFSLSNNYNYQRDNKQKIRIKSFPTEVNMKYQVNGTLYRKIKEQILLPQVKKILILLILLKKHCSYKKWEFPNF